MKTKRWLFGILLTGIMMGCFICAFNDSGLSAKTVESIEITETSLVENTEYNGPAIIKEDIDLNGHMLKVNGDLEIAADVTLNQGMLVVTGDILHTSGRVIVGQGVIEVIGDYRIQRQRIMTDGSAQYAASDGILEMEHENALVKISGDFIIHSAVSSEYTYYYGIYTASHYSAGTIEIGGDIIQKNGNEKNFCCWNKHKVKLVGEKTHTIEFESSESNFANLESEGKIVWKGYTNIKKLFSDLDIESETGEELVLGEIGVNGKSLNIKSDVRFNGNITLDGGIIKVEGSVLQTGGKVTIDHGALEVSGDYRIQNTRYLPDKTIEYIGSDGTIEMQEIDGLIRIKGDFITQSTKPDYNYDTYNYYRAGAMEIGGDVIQKNGDPKNFYCSNNHKVILNGKKPQKVEFESSEACFNYLLITRPLSDYTFTFNPCWNSLEESATSIADCTVKSISKKAYTGKAIKPSLTITYQGTKLVQGTDYTVTYANNKNTGKATVTIKGIGAYTGTVKKTFNIVPVKVASVKAASSTAKTATITWKEDKTATGYVIEYSTDKAFKKSVSKVTISKNSTTSRQIEKLTSKKTYYFRIRAYKTISGKKVYGAYSSVATVQVK